MPESPSAQVKRTVMAWFVHEPDTYGEPSAFVAEAAIVGGVVSPTTCTVNDPAAVWPALSVELQSTVVVPTGKLDPEAGVQSTRGFRSVSSVAAAANVTGPACGTLMSAGRWSAGAVTSALCRTVAVSES